MDTATEPELFKVIETDTTTGSELAAFLNEIRTVWRRADAERRGRMRRGILVVLRGCRDQESHSSPAARTLEITDDGWFTERAGEFEVMDREQLLQEARHWAFAAQRATLDARNARNGGAALIKDISRRLAGAKYLARSGKTIRADDLKVILDDCVTCDGPGEVVRDGYVTCRACAEAMSAQKAGAQGADSGTLFAPGGEG